MAKNNEKKTQAPKMGRKVAAFDRTLSDYNVASVKTTDLFKSKLKDDVLGGRVFCAMRRNNEIHFYYKGGKVFGWKSKSFQTHVAYVALSNARGKKSSYVTEEKAQGLKFAESFQENYEGIKKACDHFSGNERKMVCDYAAKYSYLKKHDGVCVLDIEIGFSSDPDTFVDQKESEGSPRIDMLLWNRTSSKLGFVEVKLAENQELVADLDSSPEVQGQIEKYLRYLAGRELREQILNAYQSCLPRFLDLFGVEQNDPLRIMTPKELVSDRVGLLVIGDVGDGQRQPIQKAINPNRLVVCKKNIEDPNSLWKQFFS